MEDRFLFRIWDKDRKKMFNCIQINFTENAHGSNSLKDNESSIHLMYQPHLILMQSTGLKDKNGKLIFEGDIVLLPDEEDVPYVVNYDIDRAMFVVESQILHLCCNFDNYYGKELEVIGNRYENPELLKECE